MKHDFDRDEAKKFLMQREEKEKNSLEQERQNILQKAMIVLTEEFKGSNVEVFLVGSVTKPFHFSTASDVDIVLKNFKGDRFEVWTRLEEMIGRESGDYPL